MASLRPEMRLRFASAVLGMAPAFAATLATSGLSMSMNNPGNPPAMTQITARMNMAASEKRSTSLACSA